jgi:hypothetical protein
MKRLTWFAVSCLLVYLSWRFAVWHLLWQLALIVGTFVWVGLGLWMLGRRLREKRSPAVPAASIESVRRALAARAQFVSQMGEDAAIRIESKDPGFWARAAEYKAVGK